MESLKSIPKSVKWSVVLMTVLGVAVGTLLSYPRAHAQPGIVCSVGPSTGSMNSSLNGTPSETAVRFARQIHSALCPTGCGTIVLYRNPQLPNAITYTQGVGVSHIVYGADFFNQIATAFSDDGVWGILAHEVGHHVDINFQAGFMNSSWGRELRADAWAGCALARTGRSTRGVERAMSAMMAYPSQSHPGASTRIPALREGFVACGGDPTTFVDAAHNF